MNKKLLTIAIALVILAMVVAPVAAKLPAKSPLPPNNPFNIIWTLLLDLQSQIKNIQTTPGPTGPTGAQGPMGPAGKDGAQGPAGSGGGKVVIRCDELTGENWVSSDPGTHQCNLACPTGTILLEAQYDNQELVLFDLGDTGIWRMFLDTDSYDHKGIGICL